MMTLGSPSRSPSPATRAARQKISARRRAAITSSCVPGAVPGDPVGDPQPLGACLQPRRERAAADMLEAPVQSGGQPSQRVDQHVEALLLHRARHADDADRARRIAPVAAERAMRRRETAPPPGRDRPARGRRQASARADGRDSSGCRSPANGRRRSSRASPSPGWSRRPWRGRRCCRAGRAELRRSGRPRPGCAGSGHAAIPWSAGSSAASTQAWPKPPAAVGREVAGEVAQPDAQQPPERTPRGPPARARAAPARAPDRDTPAGSAPGNGSPRAGDGRGRRWDGAARRSRAPDPAAPAPAAPGR